MGRTALPEVPAEHHAEVFDACRLALSDVPDHLALLEFAYQDTVRVPVLTWGAFVFPGVAS